MKLSLNFLFVMLLATTAFAQNSNQFLKIDSISFRSANFQMMKEFERDSQFLNSPHIPLRESQLEDRQNSNANFLAPAKTVNNQYLSVFFSNLSSKKIKSVSFLFRLNQNGRNLFERKIKGNITSRNGRYYISEKFFSSKNLSDSSLDKEIIIKKIEFEDGTKLKF